MSREWKPGDVIRRNDPDVIGLRVAGDGQRSARWVFSHGYECDEWVIGGIYPLAVIDPEDREQVKRLMREARNNDRLGVESMQAALRSLLAPEKPAEPTGLGAVVEDADGHTWVRTERRPWPWLRTDAVDAVDAVDATDYAEIAAVKMLSPGVTA